MKMRNVLSLSIFLLILAMTSQTGNAQNSNCPKAQNSGCQHNKQMKRDSVCRMVSDLSPEQEKKVNELRTSHQNKMASMRDELVAKRTELRQLETAEKTDMKKINAKIDEIGKIETNIDKERAKHIQDVRSLLNKDQLASFDARVNSGECCMRGNMEQRQTRQNCPAKN
jgi:Spy/CpxP family protein refolding chaperone